MPRFSEARGAFLLTVEECAQAASCSTKTIRRAMSRSGAYVETHQVLWEDGKGASTVRFIDPRSLGLELHEASVSVQLPEGQLDRQLDITEAVGHEAKSAYSTLETPKSGGLQLEAVGHEAVGHPPCIDIQQAQHRLGLITPLLDLAKAQRPAAVLEIATRENVTPSTVYSWLRSYQQKGLHALGRKVRFDKGALRLPADQYHLAILGLVNNRAASTRMLHRTLKRACDLRISEPTLRRIRDRLLSDPHTRLMLTDADARKEYLRTYAGEVFAAHANQLWQLDMTRCDILVWDTETARVIRPRVHAIIDVYSGCIVSIVFSESEDQAQTDAAIGSALIPKPAPFADAWPVFGTPERLYMDNGKTYRSGHVHRYLSDLGVEVVHSRPRVSHTRGKIERFFGTLHGYEKTMPGYCGPNASERATEELRRITKNTLTWTQNGRDPGWGNRLLTLDEFRARALAALFTDYHDTIVHGKSRLMHFLETAPAKSQRLYSQEDLVLTLARREKRTVNPDGSVRFANRFWTVESGELANYVSFEVLVLTNPVLPDIPYLIAFEPKHGGLEIVGRAAPMPEHAASDEARLLRANSKAAKKREVQRQTQQRRELMNPHIAIPNVLLEQAQAELNIEPLPPAQLPKARLQALKGPLPDLEDADDPFPEFGREPELQGETIDDIFRELRERRR